MSTIIRVFDVRILKLRNGFIVLTYPVHPDMVFSKPRVSGTLTVTVVCNLRLCDDSVINLLALVIGHLVFIDVLVGVDECGTGGGIIVDTRLNRVGHYTLCLATRIIFTIRFPTI